MLNSQKVGLLGEIYAARYLRDLNYRILSANYKSKTGEIDIIATDGSFLCFVEVKTRQVGTMLPPSSAVDYEKQKNIKSTAYFYKQITKNSLPDRFDIIEIVMQGEQYTVNHIKDAF